MSDGSDQIVSLDVAAIGELGSALAAAGSKIQSAAGGVSRTGPPVPYDWFDLGHEIVALDEAREAFDLRVAGLLAEQGRAASEQVAKSRAADTNGLG